MGRCPACSQEVCLSRWGLFRSNEAVGSPHPPASRCGRTQSRGKPCSSAQGPQDRAAVPRASVGLVSHVRGGNLEDRRPEVAEPCLGAQGSFRKRDGPARPRSGRTVRAGVKPREYPRGSQAPRCSKDADTWPLDTWMPSLSLWEPHPGPALCARGGSPPSPSPPRARGHSLPVPPLPGALHLQSPPDTLLQEAGADALETGRWAEPPGPSIPGCVTPGTCLSLLCRFVCKPRTEPGARQHCCAFSEARSDSCWDQGRAGGREPEGQDLSAGFRSQVGVTAKAHLQGMGDGEGKGPEAGAFIRSLDACGRLCLAQPLRAQASGSQESDRFPLSRLSARGGGSRLRPGTRRSCPPAVTSLASHRHLGCAPGSPGLV